MSRVSRRAEEAEWAMARPGETEHELALRRTRKRVRELRSFYIAVSVYAFAVPALWTVNWLTMRQGGSGWWAQWATLGWGIGLSVWGISLYLQGSHGLFSAEWEERKVQELMARANLKKVSSEKQLVQAQLRLLQAQIEPHFLFNTLANVQGLITRQPGVAQHMLDNFIAYLRQSLAASRNAQGTLGQEFALLRTYLDLLKIRMAERLTYTLDLPEPLAELPLPPMLLQPLVENAVRHGLEPHVAGGHVRVSAFERSGQLHIEIADNGLGFASSANAQGSDGSKQTGGVGLSNLRERLAVLYDGKADIEWVEASPGTLVRLRLPMV